jgi:hypothetical protein
MSRFTKANAFASLALLRKIMGCARLIVLTILSKFKANAEYAHPMLSMIKLARLASALAITDSMLTGFANLLPTTHLTTHLTIHLTTHLTTHLTIHLTTHLTIHLTTHLTIHLLITLLQAMILQSLVSLS